MWYVHYTVRNAVDIIRNGVHDDGQKLVAGPYTADEVIDKRRELAGAAYVTDCFISELPSHA